MTGSPNIRTANSAASQRLAGGCFHCGEPCPEGAFVLNDKPFCCLGCQTVYSLLQENGLDHFYQLQSAPGTRIRPDANAAKWAFLDDASVQETLLEFSDGTCARVTFHLPTIHCIACVWLLENLFKLNDGVGSSRVHFPRREVTITFYPGKITLGGLAALVESVGYTPELNQGTGKKRSLRFQQRQWIQMGLAGFAFGNIMLMSLPFYLGLDRLNGPWFENMAGWLGLVFGLPVVTYSAGDFWQAAWLGLRRRTLTMEIPIILGLSAIYGTSCFDVMSHRGPGYGDSLCGLVFFLLCGRMFQMKTHERLTFDRDFKGFFPLSVVRKTGLGEGVVAISRIQTGDHLILRNGELLPADGTLVEGGAFMDYSFITGESQPVAVAAGGRLYAGGRQVGGAIEVETVKPVEQSQLAALWDNEAFRKPRENDLESLTNRYSRYFTKTVLCVALGAAVFWFHWDGGKALKVFISVLIVACPCALALAAPLTHGTAQRILERWQVFLKNPMVLERMSGVDTLIFDKTGTLTASRSGGVKFQSCGAGPIAHGLTAQESDEIGSLARMSIHPLSLRIAGAVSFHARPVQDFEEFPGGGIAGKVDGRLILLGSRDWLNQRGVSCQAEWPVQSGSSVGVALDGLFRGAFEVRNDLRPEVEQLVSKLKGRFNLIMLSGDNDRETDLFRRLLGDKAVLKFNQSPVDKLHFIRVLQQSGHRVMMVGDGLNDAGALRQSDVGIAVVEEIGSFSPASDVILDAAHLPRLAEVLSYSRQSAWVVRSGFAISAVYNLAGVSVAASGWLVPIVCAILMPLSSATVVVFSCLTTAWLGTRTLRGLSPVLKPREMPGQVGGAAAAWEVA